MSDEEAGRLGAKTIGDFGHQWSRFTDNEGYYASAEMFEDIVGGLLSRSDIDGKRVADIGSGTGRIVKMLLVLGAGHVTALEPADGAFWTLQRNTADNAERVTLINGAGESVAGAGPFDLVVSIGVIHHIPEPDTVVAATYEALKPGGKCLFWLYGEEGNETYLAIIRPLRRITSLLPHAVLTALCAVLNVALGAYVRLCRWVDTRAPSVRLPLQAYANNVLSKLTREQRHLVIYDQLNPAYAKYYQQSEAVELLARNGFENCKTHHRHGYSWTISGTKPAHRNTAGAT